MVEAFCYSLVDIPSEWNKIYYPEIALNLMLVVQCASVQRDRSHGVEGHLGAQKLPAPGSHNCSPF